MIRRAAMTVLAASALAAVLPSLASAHARVSPAVSQSGQLQLYSLAVPTEKSNLATTKVVMTVPRGFAIDSVVAPPAGWQQQVQQTGSGDGGVVTKVTWAGGHTPTGEASLFQFLAQPSAAQTYTFQVQQTYSDGSIVDWSGAESSAAPAPTIEVKNSLGGGGVSVLTILALIVGILGLLAGGFALLSGTGGGDASGQRRPLV